MTPWLWFAIAWLCANAVFVLAASRFFRPDPEPGNAPARGERVQQADAAQRRMRG